MAAACLGGGDSAEINDEPPPIFIEPRTLEIKAKPSAIKTKAIRVEAKPIPVIATFYTARCVGCSGITRTGIDVRQTIWHEGKRIIAVDPALIPLGSTVVITLENGDTFEATAQDTGGDIKGARIDVLVETKSEAYNLGRQSAEVEIISEGKW